MALSDCPKCWDTPCTCGHDAPAIRGAIRTWSPEALRDLARDLRAIAAERGIDLEQGDTPAPGRS